MDIRGLAIWGCKIDPNFQVFNILAEIYDLAKDDFPETKDWDRNDSWRGDPDEVDEFAVAYHTVYEIRKKYPFITLLINEIDYDINNLKNLNLQNIENIKLNVNFTPSYHQDIIANYYTSSRLLHLGTNSDFKQFAYAIFSPLGLSWITFLLSRKYTYLNEIKNELEPILNINDFRAGACEGAGELVVVSS